MPPTDHVLMTLGVQASAHREQARLIEANVRDAGVLIANHDDTAHLYDLLREAVTDGLLTELEARYAA